MFVVDDHRSPGNAAEPPHVHGPGIELSASAR
jgi:hypothetical protein